jgi:hypothetical protein
MSDIDSDLRDARLEQKKIMVFSAVPRYWLQGDQMSLWKNRPKSSPTHFLSLLMHKLKSGIKMPQNVIFFW